MPLLHVALGHVELLHAAALRVIGNEAPETGTVGIVAAEKTSIANGIDDGIERDSRPDEGRHIARRYQAHHRGGG
jgi:hypothetical protein